MESAKAAAAKWRGEHYSVGALSAPLRRCVECSEQRAPSLPSPSVPRGRALLLRFWLGGVEAEAVLRHPLLRRKPSVERWEGWAERALAWGREGSTVGQRWREWLRESGELRRLSALQCAVLEGRLQRVREALGGGGEGGAEGEALLLHLAVLSGSTQCLELLHRCGLCTDRRLAERDPHSGFSALHLAFVLQNREAVALLWLRCGAPLGLTDRFGGTALDHARLLRLTPNCRVYPKRRWRKFGPFLRAVLRGEGVSALESGEWEARGFDDAECSWINYWDKQEKRLERLSLAQWEHLSNTHYQAAYSVPNAWYDELFFRHIPIAQGAADVAHRYAHLLDNTEAPPVSEELAISYISLQAGFGLFALRSFAAEQCICKWIGRYETERPRWKEAERTTEMRLNVMRQIHQLGERGKNLIQVPQRPHYARDPCYNYVVPGTSFYINCKENRNEAGFINHSEHPNATLLGCWSGGIYQVLVVALRPIQRGEQILVDYEEHFWKPWRKRKEEREEQRRAGRRDASISGNYDAEQSAAARDERYFFKPQQAREMGRGEGWPRFIRELQREETTLQ